MNDTDEDNIVCEGTLYPDGRQTRRFYAVDPKTKKRRQIGPTEYLLHGKPAVTETQKTVETKQGAKQ